MLFRLDLILFFLAFLFAGSATAQSGRNVVRPTPTPTPTPVLADDQNLKIETEEIKINVSAFDTKGNFFPNVGISDIVIDEDNVLHQATSVRRTPANVLIVLDTGGEERIAKDLKATRNTARLLIESLAPEDSVALLEAGESARIITEWTTDKPTLYSALIKDLSVGKRSRLVDAFDLAVEFFRKSGVENRHLVVITDGLDSTSSEQKRDAAFARLLSTDINVHVFSYTRMEIAAVEKRKRSMVRTGPAPRQQLPPGADVPVQGRTKTYPTITINTDREMIKKNRQRGESLERSEKALSELTANTNGIIFLPETIDEMYAKTAYLARNIDAQYVVTYTPKRPLARSPGGEFREITITSKRDGLEIIGKRKLAIIR